MFSRSLQWIMFAALAAILFATGYLIGTQHRSADLETAFQSGLQGAANLAGTGEKGAADTVSQTPSTVRVVTGTITAIANDHINIRTDQPTTNITVATTNDTAYALRTPKEASAIDQEQVAYQRASQKNPATAAAPPDPFIDSPAARDDLRVGDLVEVTTKTPDGSSDALLAGKIVHFAPPPSP